MSAPIPVRSTENLDRIWSRGKEFLGSELPVMCGAMTWISDPKLVSLMSNLGAFGVLAAGNMPPELFAQYVNDTRELTDRPFAGNVITIAPNYQAHLDILCQAKVSHIVFAGSLPRGSEVEQAKKSGAKVDARVPGDGKLAVIQCGLHWGAGLPYNHKYDFLPDYIVYTDERDQDGSNSALCAGFFDKEWALDPGQMYVRPQKSPPRLP